MKQTILKACRTWNFFTKLTTKYDEMDRHSYVINQIYKRLNVLKL